MSASAGKRRTNRTPIGTPSKARKPRVRTSETLPQLPEAAWCTVLASLQTRDRARAAAVCKEWKAICADPRMWEALDLHDALPPARGSWIFSSSKESLEAMLDRVVGVKKWLAEHAAGLTQLQYCEEMQDEWDRTRNHESSYHVIKQPLLAVVKDAPLTSLRIDKLSLTHLEDELFRGLGKTLRHLVLPAMTFDASLSMGELPALLPRLETYAASVSWWPKSQLTDEAAPSHTVRQAAEHCPGLRHLQLATNYESWLLHPNDLLPEEATRLTALTCLCITVGLPMTFERAQAPKPEWRLPLAAPGLRYLKLVEVDSHERNPLAIVSDILPPLEHNLAHLTALETLRCSRLSWLCPLPPSLTALQLDLRSSHRDWEPEVTMLCCSLVTMAALRHFELIGCPDVKKALLAQSQQQTLVEALAKGTAGRLRVLKLQSCGLGSLLPTLAEELPELRCLDVSSNTRVMASGWPPALADMASLRHLSFCNCGPSSIKHFAETGKDVLAKLPALETVEVRAREPPRRNAPPSKANNDINQAFEQLNRERTRHKYGYRAVSGPTVAWKPVSEQKALMEFLPSQRAELPCHCELQDPDVAFDRCQLLRSPQLDPQFRHDCFAPPPRKFGGYWGPADDPWYQMQMGLGLHFQVLP